MQLVRAVTATFCRATRHFRIALYSELGEWGAEVRYPGYRRQTATFEGLSGWEVLKSEAAFPIYADAIPTILTHVVVVSMDGRTKWKIPLKKLTTLSYGEGFIIPARGLQLSQDSLWGADE